MLVCTIVCLPSIKMAAAFKIWVQIYFLNAIAAVYSTHQSHPLHAHTFFFLPSAQWGVEWII